MTKLSITGIDIANHPNGDFIVIDIRRGVKNGAHERTSTSLHLSDWKHTRRQAERQLRRARQIQDALFNKINFKGKQK